MSDLVELFQNLESLDLLIFIDLQNNQLDECDSLLKKRKACLAQIGGPVVRSQLKEISVQNQKILQQLSDKAVGRQTKITNLVKKFLQDSKRKLYQFKQKRPKPSPYSSRKNQSTTQMKV